MVALKEISKLGTDKKILIAAASVRWSEADALWTAGHKIGAIILGMYALELQLKARICDVLGVSECPTALYVHDLEGLWLFAGLRKIPAAELIRHGDLAKMLATTKKWAISQKNQNWDDLRYLDPASIVAIELDQVWSCLEGVVKWMQENS